MADLRACFFPRKRDLERERLSQTKLNAETIPPIRNIAAVTASKRNKAGKANKNEASKISRGILFNIFSSNGSVS